MVVLHTPSEAAAQFVAGHSIGEDRSEVGRRCLAEQFRRICRRKLKAANGAEVPATSEQSIGKLVRLEVKWAEKVLRQLAYFSDFSSAKQLSQI